MNETNYFCGIACSVTCGKECGSGFLISNNLIVTATHVITDYIENNERILIEFEGDLECEANPIGRTDYPIIALKLSQNIERKINSVAGFELEENDTAKAYGFLSCNDSADIISLKVNRILGEGDINEEYCNTWFTINAGERISDFSGLSGSLVISKGSVVGILVRQIIQGNVAIRLRGICGVEFRNYLEQQGVIIQVSEQNNFSKEATYGEIRSFGAVEVSYTSEIDKLYNSLFEPIRRARLNGEILKSQTELNDFFTKLSESSASREKKAEFYFAGAVWMLLDDYTDDAAKYLALAKENKDDLDDRIYKGYELLKFGETEKAKEILKPLDMISVLNTYISCLIDEKKELSEIKVVIEASGLKENIHTYHLLAIAALNTSKFGEGHAYLNQIYSTGVHSPEIQILDALLYYWQAMGDFYRFSERKGFVCGSNLHFYPSREQTENLEKAYSILNSIYSEELIKNNYNNALTVIWGLLVISTLLPGKDWMLWLDRFRKQERLNPLGILFCINRGLNIPDDICKEFLDLEIPESRRGIFAYTAMELLIEKEEQEKAVGVFETYKEDIAIFQSKSVDECELYLLIQCKDYSGARKKLKEINLPSEVKERYEIGISDSSETHAIKNLVGKVVNLAKNTKETIDFQNADIICKKNKKWKFMESNAKRWWNETKEIVALQSMAEALYEQGRYDKSLKTVNLAESHGDCSERIRYCKLNCLTALARYDEAIRLIETFENVQLNKQLALARANIFIAEGKREKAIQVLKEFADRDLYDLSVYKQLVNLLLIEDHDLAFEYAHSIYLNDPTNPDIIRFVGYIGIITGHEDISEEYFALLQEDEKTGKNVRMVTISEIRKMIAEENERNKKINDLYLNMQIPIHMAADEDTNPLGGVLYLEEIKKGPRYARFWKRNLVQQIDLSVPLVLDYTMCMILYSLNILNEICALFSQVWIPYHQFGALWNDTANLKKFQEHIAKREIQLSDQLNSQKYKMQPAYQPKASDGVFERTDVIDLNCAKFNNAIIIAKDSSGAVLNSSVPDEWEDYCIDTNSFYAALEKFSLEHPDYENKDVNFDLVQKIIPHCNLVLNHVVLSELLDAEALDMVFTYFNVILPEETVEQIHLSANQHRNRIATIDRLEGINRVISSLRECGKIKIMPMPDVQRDIDSLYAQLLYEEIWLSEKNKCYLGIDDRYFNQYTGFNSKMGSNQILSTYDLLTCLETEGIIKSNEYFRHIDQLISMRYCYFVPKATYLFSRLSLAKIHNEGYVIEDQKLRLLRQIVAYTFWPLGGLFENVKSGRLYSEHMEYMADIIVELRKCLLMIWKSNRSLEWKRAASDWLLCFWGDYITDTKKEKEPSKSILPLKQAMLLTLAIELWENSESMSQYIEWLSPYLLVFWQANPYQVEKVAEQILIKIENLSAFDGYQESAKIVNFIWGSFLSKLPDRLLNCILDNPRGAKFEKIIHLIRPRYFRSFFSAYESDDIPKLDIKGILFGEAKACENAILCMLLNPDDTVKTIIDEIAEEEICELDNETIYFVARFLGNLVWYCPEDKQYLINEKKRLLSLFIKNE